MISEMNFLERIVYLLQQYGTSYLKGAGTTLVIALVSTFVGCVIGFAVGIVQTIPSDPKRDSVVKRVLLKIVKIIMVDIKIIKEKKSINRYFYLTF